MSGVKVKHPWADSDSDIEDESDKKFIHEGTVMVTVDEVTHDGAWKYWEAKKADLLAQKNGKILVLTGSHGSHDGRDGVSDLDMLTASVPSKGSKVVYNKQQTRGFYEKWTKSDYFGVSAEPANDPRIYTPYTGRDGRTFYKVTGIKPIPEGKMPQPVANTRLLNSKSTDLKVLVLDVAYFHKRDEELVAFIKKFEPTSLIIDWCFTKNGYTANLLARSGIISQIIAENKKYLVTGVRDRAIIELGPGQGGVLDRVKQDMEDPALKERWGKATVCSQAASYYIEYYLKGLLQNQNGLICKNCLNCSYISLVDLKGTRSTFDH